MTRILLISTSYPDQADGQAAAGVFVRDFAGALMDLNVAVEVVAPALDFSMSKENGIDVSRFAVPKLPLSLLNPLNPRDWSSIASTLVGGDRAVMKACNTIRPDHIIALWTLPSGHWAMRASQRYGTPYSVWALGSDIWTLARMPGLRQYTARVLDRAERLFADGYQLAADVKQISHRPCDFLPSSRLFCKKASKSPASGPPYRLAFLGRWHRNKGVDLLLDALELLHDRDWANIEAIRIYGGGPMEEKVKTQISGLVDSGRSVESGGFLDLEGAKSLFDWADYVIIPSRIESIPVVFSDAMQAGRPVISTPVGDLPQLVKSFRCGILAERTDPPALALAIRQATNTPPIGYVSKLAQAAAMLDIRSAASSLLSSIV